MLISRPVPPASPPETGSSEIPAETPGQPAPGAMALLGAARRALREELGPQLAEPQAQAACDLVERALGLVERDLMHGDRETEDAAAFVKLLEGLYGQSLVAAAGSTVAARASAMDARLTRDIRDGTLDGACAAGVREILYLRTRQRLATVNPEYLALAESAESAA